jgi:hypothetical protein
LLRWLEAGAPNDSPGSDGKPSAPECTQLELLPGSLLLEGPGQSFKMTVRARYADGTDRDVTNLALFLTNNESVAKMEKDGTLTTGQRGEAFVMARFATHTVGAHVIRDSQGAGVYLPANRGAKFCRYSRRSKSCAIFACSPSETCNDEIFLRRACIDIIGLLPTSDEVRKFVVDTDPAKRSKKIDELLARDEFRRSVGPQMERVAADSHGAKQRGRLQGHARLFTLGFTTS